MVAGGSGRRFGDRKQFLQLAGRPVAAWAVAAARTVSDGVVLVVPVTPAVDRGDRSGPTTSALPSMGADRVVEGGSTRAASVRAGLAAVPSDAGTIVVHDAARPLATHALFESVIAALDNDAVDGVIPVVAVTDTLKRVENGAVVDTIDRDPLGAVQTPQAFDATVLRRVHADGGEATDDAGLLERGGATVQTVPGESRNIKLTTTDDLVVAEALVGQPGGTHRPGAIRIGQGIDVHRFSDQPDRPLVLGGVTIEGDGVRGLDGHSDADAVAHAIADAVLGAAGLGDLGHHAPDTDPRWAGADSMALLSAMVGLARRAGWEPVNADCTVVAEQPRLAPYVDSMAEGLRAVLGAPVNVKATRAEGLGALGRAEGIACTAVAILSRVDGTDR